jgi:hypothetical protein
MPHHVALHTLKNCVNQRMRRLDAATLDGAPQHSLREHIRTSRRIVNPPPMAVGHPGGVHRQQDAGQKIVSAGGQPKAQTGQHAGAGIQIPGQQESGSMTETAS